MKRVFILAGLQCWLNMLVPALFASEAEAVIVIYNSNLAESRNLAGYYAARRGIPTNQVIGLDLPSTETITRQEYRDRLERPLLRKLERAKLFTFASTIKPLGKDLPSEIPRIPVQTRIRYAALCYGVPLKIQHDPNLGEESAEKLQSELRKNEAAVDSELALLPASGLRLPAFGPLASPVFGTTNRASLNPTNGVLMVCRLDGPTVEIARGLVDKAIQAETEGLWGRAYFDARGLLLGSSKVGDDWIKGAAEVTRRLGFETILDNKDERFPASFPMSQIAFYAGWYEYDGQVSGPFTRPVVEFMPGAFGYHLHSFSAQTLRSATQYWAGPLLDKGVTATMGCVYEPYLEFTPNLGVFFHRFIHLGFSFGEAAYASQRTLSWQTTVVGDPLYRPFAKKPMQQHEELLARKNRLIEWSHLKVININLVTDLPTTNLIEYLEQTPALTESPVLLEKLADLYLLRTQFSKAAENYKRAAQQASSRQQRIRVLLALARTLELFASPEEIYDAYQEFVKSFPEYPDLLAIYRKLLPLAEQLKKATDREHFQHEIDRLNSLGRAKS
jgi:uncharacterized protein (TIGR03790 family)